MQKVMIHISAERVWRIREAIETMINNGYRIDNMKVFNDVLYIVYSDTAEKGNE